MTFTGLHAQLRRGTVCCEPLAMRAGHHPDARPVHDQRGCGDVCRIETPRAHGAEIIVNDAVKALAVAACTMPLNQDQLPASAASSAGVND